MTAPQHPSDWKVVYGDRRQFTAYFGDRGKADHYAFTHGGFVIPLSL